MFDLTSIISVNIKGFVVVSIISFNDEIRAEKSKEELSGFPFVAESVKLDDHIPSNSISKFFFFTFKFSIINPVNELCDSKILTIFSTLLIFLVSISCFAA